MNHFAARGGINIETAEQFVELLELKHYPKCSFAGKPTAPSSHPFLLLLVFRNTPGVQYRTVRNQTFLSRLLYFSWDTLREESSYGSDQKDSHTVCFNPFIMSCVCVRH